MAEAFVATFKSELVDGLRFGSFEHTEHETLAWISFYNNERLHEELGDVPPAEYERNFEMTDRPSGPGEAVQPALQWGALAGLKGRVSARYPSLQETQGASLTGHKTQGLTVERAFVLADGKER